MKKDGKDIGGRCIKGKNGKFGFSEKDIKIIWKNYIKEIIGTRDRS